MRNRTLWQSLHNALNGLLGAIREERNAPLLFLAAVLALALALIVGLEGLSLALLILTIVMVLAAELFNTALERLLDLLHREYHPHVQRIKDLAAGAVLLGALGALAIGLLLFWGPLLGSEELLVSRILSGLLIFFWIVLVLVGRLRR